MTRLALSGAVAAVLLGFAPSAGAQSVPGTVVVGTGPSAPVAAAAPVPPGGRKIGDALYAAQPGVAPGAPRPWTRDDIAAARAHEGWGRVYKDMKADGVVDAPNLGQAIKGERGGAREGGQEYRYRHRVVARTFERHHAPVVVTYGDGSTAALGGSRAAHAGAHGEYGGRHAPTWDRAGMAHANGAGAVHGEGAGHHYAFSHGTAMTSAAGGAMAPGGGAHGGGGGGRHGR